MTLLAKFTARVKPLSKERPRTGKNGHVYTPKRTQEYEQAIRAAAIMQLPEGFQIPTTPVKLFVLCQNEVPKSWSKAKQARALTFQIYPSRGDLDNRVKAVSDALNGVYYIDDVQVVQLEAKMQYGLGDMVHAAIYEVAGSNEDDNESSVGVGG